MTKEQTPEEYSTCCIVRPIEIAGKNLAKKFRKFVKFMPGFIEKVRREEKRRGVRK